jgi:hypothetical protein
MTIAPQRLTTLSRGGHVAQKKAVQRIRPRIQKKLPDAAAPVNSHADSMPFFGADMPASAISASLAAHRGTSRRRIGDAGGRLAASAISASPRGASAKVRAAPAIVLPANQSRYPRIARS